MFQGSMLWPDRAPRLYKEEVAAQSREIVPINITVGTRPDQTGPPSYTTH